MDQETHGQRRLAGDHPQVAVEAERIGLDSVWSWERLMRPTVPIPLGGAGGPVMDAPEMFGIVYDPIETLAYVAAQTSRITLGTSVLDALFQSPIILARRLATPPSRGRARLLELCGRPAQPAPASGTARQRVTLLLRFRPWMRSLRSLIRHAGRSYLRWHAAISAPARSQRSSPYPGPPSAAISGCSGRPAWSATNSLGGVGSTTSTWTGWLQSRLG